MCMDRNAEKHRPGPAQLGPRGVKTMTSRVALLVLGKYSVTEYRLPDSIVAQLALSTCKLQDNKNSAFVTFTQLSRGSMLK